jgi:tetrahydromethanopterin S-methyltransferase subunit G
MENPPDVPTFEHRVLAELRAIRRQLDDIEKRVKSIEQEAARVRRAVKA